MVVLKGEGGINISFIIFLFIIHFNFDIIYFIIMGIIFFFGNVILWNS